MQGTEGQGGKKGTSLQEGVPPGECAAGERSQTRRCGKHCAREACSWGPGETPGLERLCHTDPLNVLTHLCTKKPSVFSLQLPLNFHECPFSKSGHWCQKPKG